MIKVSMSLEQARIIVLAYGTEVEPTYYGTKEYLTKAPVPHKPDHVRRAIIQCALDVVRAHADEALGALIDEATPQARNEYSHLVR
jgi:hypothetical protein